MASFLLDRDAKEYYDKERIVSGNRCNSCTSPSP